MICDARGFPESTYTMLNNGIPVAHDGKHIINIRNKSNLEKNECMAENSIIVRTSVWYFLLTLSSEVKVLTPVRIDCKILLIAGAGSLSDGIFFTIC